MTTTYAGNRQREPREERPGDEQSRAAARTGRAAPPRPAEIEETASYRPAEFGLTEQTSRIRRPRGERVQTVQSTRPGSLAQPRRVQPGSAEHTQAIQREVDELLEAGFNLQRQRASRSVTWNTIEAQAKRWLGVPYRWGGENPATGLDCSAYVQLVFRSIGVNLPRVSRQQARAGVEVAGGLTNATPGDLVFYSRNGVVHHVGIYAGQRGGRHVFYNAPYTGAKVRLEVIDPRRVSHVRRVVPSGVAPRRSGGGGNWRQSLDRYEEWIVRRESSFNPNADNPRSSAFGLGQLIRANRVHYGRMLGINPNTRDPNQQLAMMRRYIADRYGSSRNAYNWWRSHGWY